MATIDFTPLGFSDLTDEEALVVSAFRSWNSNAATCREAASCLTGMSKSDRWHDSLQLVFDHFTAPADPHRHDAKNGSSVLSPVEEALLNEIGSIDTVTKRCVKAFQQVLEEEGALIRPASAIPRSGHDYLVEVIERKATEVHQMLYPEPRGARGLQNRLSRSGFVGDSEA